jgi:hypothetical protein
MSDNSLKEIIDQSNAVVTSPEYGVRTLDLGSVYPNSTASSTSPLASSIQSIPSYTPPAQSGSAAPAAVNIPSIPSSSNFSSAKTNSPQSGGISNIPSNVSSPFAPATSSDTGTEIDIGTGGAASNAFMSAFGGGGADTSGGFGEGATTVEA